MNKHYNTYYEIVDKYAAVVWGWLCVGIITGALVAVAILVFKWILILLGVI